MPIFFGMVYPEIRKAGLISRILRILLDHRGEIGQVLEFARSISVLRKYLDSIPGTPAQLEVFVADNTIPEHLRFFELKTVTRVSSCLDRTEELLKMVERIDADLIVVDDPLSLNNCVLEKHPEIAFVNHEDALTNIEVFVKGNEIPWSFSQPVWNMPWSAFYSMLDEYGSTTFQDYQSKFMSAGLDPVNLEIARSLLLNRLDYISFTKDKLSFFVMQRRYAKRKGWQRQNFIFEVSYYLNHYYLLLYGGLDQLARIINAILKLGVRSRFGTSLLNEKFVRKIRSKNSKLGDLFTEETFLEWTENLKLVRHYVAHQGVVVLSPLAKEPKDEPMDEEIDKEMMARPEYKSVAILPPRMRDQYLKMLKEITRLSMLEITRDDAMVIQNQDSKTLLFPLDAIDWHYNNYKTIMTKSVNMLQEYLADRVTKQKT